MALKNIVFALCLLNISAAVHAEDRASDAAKNQQAVILFQQFNWASILDYGSSWVPIGVYESETICKMEIQERKEIGSKEVVIKENNPLSRGFQSNYYCGR